VALAQTGPAGCSAPPTVRNGSGRAAAAADVVILDLEDGVAAKDRHDARAALVDNPLDPDRTVVRINPATTADHGPDLEALAKTKYTTVMLAKTEDPQQIRDLAAAGRGGADRETPLGAVVVNELARMDNAFALCGVPRTCSRRRAEPPTGGPTAAIATVAKHVRSQTLLAAKAYGRMALDSVYLDIKTSTGCAARSTTPSRSASTPRSRSTRRRSPSYGRATHRAVSRRIGRDECSTRRAVNEASSNSKA